MSPQSPINELDRINVTLFCDVISGHPTYLHSVKWFMDGELLKQLPYCSENFNGNEDLCDDIDPNTLMLEHVSRMFHANYSCQGANEAGWGEFSEEEELQIYCEYFWDMKWCQY